MNRLAPLLSTLLHDARARSAWRLVLAVLIVVVGWFAFGQPLQPIPDIDGGDKINHLLAFLALGAAASFSLPPGWRASAQAAAGLLLYGAFIEAVQTQLSHREGDWQDLAADAVGVLCGLLLASGLRRVSAPAKP